MQRPGAFTPEDFLKGTVILAIVAIDATWIRLASFRFDTSGIVRVGAAIGALLLVAELYRHWRPNLSFVVMVRETAWLLAFSAAAAVLSNLVVTLNRPLVEDRIVAFDRALHLDWQAYYGWVVAHPTVGLVCALLYFTALPFVAFAIIVLPMLEMPERASELVLAAMIGALIAIAMSGLWPTAGALAYFRPDESLVLHHTIVDLDYKQAFFDLRSGALTSLSLDSIRGLIAFPSYHATLSAIIVLSFRGIRRFFWPVLALSLALLATAPVEGGHHFADVIAGVLAALVATFLATSLRRWLLAAKSRAAGIDGPSADLHATGRVPGRMQMATGRIAARDPAN